MTRQGGWPPSGFAAKLRHEREKAGLSQRQLAESVGCHYMTISELERGTQEPAWPLVLAVAKALGVGVVVFVPEDGAEGGEPVMPVARPRGRPRKQVDTEDTAEAPSSEERAAAKKGGRKNKKK
jgi:transcriptional regulator with XRE-family HTH domain